MSSSEEMLTKAFNDKVARLKETYEECLQDLTSEYKRQLHQLR